MLTPETSKRIRHMATAFPAACREAAETCRNSADPAARDWAGFFSALGTLAQKLIPLIITAFGL